MASAGRLSGRFRRRRRESRGHVLACVGLVGVSAGVGLSGCGAVSPEVPEIGLVDARDTLHDTMVADPYRSLEDTASASTRHWIRAQDSLARSTLAGLPGRAAIRERLRRLGSVRAFGAPFIAGDRYFSYETPPDLPQAVLTVRDSLGDEPRVLLDPNPLDAGGLVGVGAVAASPDGRYVAYFYYGRERWPVVRVRDVDTDEDLPHDVLAGTWFSQSYSYLDIAWRADGSGFYYAMRGPDFEEDGAPQYSRIRYHRLGSPQAEDPLLVERSGSRVETLSPLRLTPDERYLVYHATLGSARTNGLHYLDLSVPNATPVELLADGEARYTFEHAIGPEFLVSTDHGAERGRLSALNVLRPSDAGRDVVPEAQGVLSSVDVVGSRLVLTYIESQAPILRTVDMTGGSVTDLARLPPGGSFSGVREQTAQSHVFVRQATLADPGTVYRYDVRTGDAEEFATPDGMFWDPADFLVRRVEYPGRDGTAVPMYLAHRRDLALDGEAPVFMSVYGAFGVPRGASFAPFRMTWMMGGGVLAIPGTRGGGDHGASWHEAGRGVHKQNTFDDAVAAAEWLIEEGYTSAGRIGVFGFSAGGLVPPVLVNQRPDLFAAAVAANPIIDLIRARLFTGGIRWEEEFGSVDSEEEFGAMLAYSPYHNIVAERCHPRTLVVAGENDATAVPWHAYKYVAALQDAQSCANPVLMWMDWGGGHGVAGRDRQIEYYADILAFVAEGAGHDLSGGGSSAGDERRSGGAP